MAPEARARALAAHVVGPGEVPVVVALRVISELGAGFYGLDEALRRLRASATMPSLPPDLEAEVRSALEAEVRSALEAADGHRPREALDAMAEREVSEALEGLDDRSWRR